MTVFVSGDAGLHFSPSPHTRAEPTGGSLKVGGLYFEMGCVILSHRNQQSWCFLKLSSRNASSPPLAMVCLFWSTGQSLDSDSDWVTCLWAEKRSTKVENLIQPTIPPSTYITIQTDTSCLYRYGSAPTSSVENSWLCTFLTNWSVLLFFPVLTSNLDWPWRICFFFGLTSWSWLCLELQTN